MGPVRKFLNRTVVPRTLYGRSLIILILPIVVLQLVLAVIFYNRHLDTITRSLSLNVASSLAHVADNIANAVDTETQEAYAQSASQAFRFQFQLVPILDFQPGLIGFGGGSPLQHINDKIVEAFAERIGRPHSIDLRPNDPQSIEVVIPLSDQALRVIIPKKQVTSTNTALLLTWMLITALILVGIAVYYLKLQVRPIRRLAKAMSSFGKGRDDGDFTPEGPIEVRRAAIAFNRMRRRIVRHITQRTELLAAVSHDLRTPLTRMRLGLEVMDSPDDELRSSLEKDIEEMTDLVELYLSFARGEGSEGVTEVCVAELIEEVSTRMIDHRSKIRLELDYGIVASVRPFSFKRCVTNILENACAFGNIVSMRLKLVEEQIQLTIDDNGPGVASDQYDKIIKPFVTLSGPRRTDSSSVGLGLAIAHDIVLGHGGEMFLGSSPMGGLEVTIRLPA